MRRLARSPVRDPERAADVEQESPASACAGPAEDGVPEARSDAAELFVLELPASLRDETAALDVTDAGLAPVGAGRVDGEPVRIEVPLLTRFRVELAEDDPADAFEALDGDGVPLRLSEHHCFGSIVRSRVERGGDGFPVCVTSGAVAELLLLRDGVELRRVPLALDTGGVHVVRP